MTEERIKHPQRRRLLLSSLLTVIVLGATWITYFLVTFDLNNYRDNAEAKLSELLSLPVTLGEISYNLHDTNLALQIDGLQLGDDRSKLQVEAKQLLVSLLWRGLLKREFKFAKISLIQPQALIKVARDRDSSEKSSTQQLSPGVDLALLKLFSIEALEVVDGTLTIESDMTGQKMQRFAFSEFNAGISEIRLNEMAQFDIKGELTLPGQENKSLCRLQGEGGLRRNENQRLEPYFNLELDAKALELSHLREVFAGQTDKDLIKGTSDLRLHLAGAPSKEIDFQINLFSDNMSIRPSSDYTHQLSPKKLLASGHLRFHGKQPEIKDLVMQIDETRLAGEIRWTPPAEPFSATITILESGLSVPIVKRWLPDQNEDLQPFLLHLKEQGSIHVKKAEITLRENPDGGQSWQARTFKGNLLQVGWILEHGPDAEVESLAFDINGGKWKIDNGRASLGGLQITVAAAGEINGSNRVLSTLDISAKAKAETLLDEWQVPQDILQASGEIELQGHLEGPLGKLNLDLVADLSQLRIRHASGFEFPSSAEDQLDLHCTITPNKISLDHGALSWSSIKGHMAGNYLREDPDSLSFDALLTVNELANIADSIPLLKKLQLHGQADLSISQQGRPKINRPEIILTLRDAGLHATRFISDLSRINGRIRLTETGMTAKDLQVHIGRSLLSVQAQLHDFSKPRLLLDAKANAIHANDLIFKSEKALLRDIDGHLEIDRDGLTFAPVDVRLDGGTNASVRGTISFHPPFQTRLDITSEFANVREIVGLWTDHPGKPEQRPAAEVKNTQSENTVTIKAHAKNGDLYGMTFHDATATITPTRERLIIHPLLFSVGEGTCDAQVITEFSREDQPSMLRVAGHAENVDALEVYRELLKQKNILRGNLDGDFFINGEIGANYLPSSYGNFSIQVHDGVLHDFPVLSKIFSLLNVSQLFAFQLPDMHREGMPFNKLTAHFELDKGILGTEDLKIESDAMNQSYLGEIDLVNKTGDYSVAIHPLGTVDKVVSRVPIAGWLLTGENKALLTAHFSVKGKFNDYSVNAMPLDTLTEPTIGLLRRTLGLPFKLLEDPQILWGGDGTRSTAEEE